MVDTLIIYHFLFPVTCHLSLAGNFFELNSNPRLGGKPFQIKFARSSWREEEVNINIIF